jgi:hypothetical protein
LMGMSKANTVCCAIRGQPHVGFRRFMSTTAATTSRLGPGGPGFFRALGENSRPYFRVLSARMKAQERGGLQDNCGTDQPALAHEECTHANDDGIREAEIRCPLPGPIEDQQLLEEHGFGDHRTGAAGTGKSGDYREQVENEDGQVTHATILSRQHRAEIPMI